MSEKENNPTPQDGANPQERKGGGRRANIQRPRPNIGDGSLPKPKYLSTTATPLTNDPLWQQAIVVEGERGLTSEEAIKAFSADASGYVYLVEQEYHAISDCDKFFTKTVPPSAYAYYHHILWWYKIALMAQKRGTASHAQERLIHFVQGYDLRVGAGAATYLSGMGDFTDGAGVKHYLEAKEPTDDGHFGQIDAQTHRDYETLIAPSVSINRVLNDCALTLDRNAQPVMPRGIMPRGPRAAAAQAPEEGRRGRQRPRDIEELVHEDPDVAEGVEEDEEEEVDAQGQRGAERERAPLPTANLLGWAAPKVLTQIKPRS